MLYRFYVTVHAQPSAALVGVDIELADRKLRSLLVPREALAGTTMNLSFEEARQRLAGLERMYCEPDGSFVWASAHDEPPWQVDGNLYDRNDRLLFVDLKGACPREQFDRLLSCFGWPETKLVFQLTREAVFLDEEEFRRVAAS